nr:DUF2235 domain-containing protein [uncultured Albidiferax sp.]
MANDALQAAMVANRDVPDCKPGPNQDCSDIVHISVFFDGTGNNRDQDIATKKWSNVARMFDSALEMQEPSKGIYTIYISGVGTPYNGKPVRWLSSAGVWIQDGKPGDGFGSGGSRRLDQGDDAVNDRLRDVLIANAKAQGGKVGKYAEAGSAKSFSEVNAALAGHRLIKVINLSIFGFSRGAALARAFSNRVLGSCEQKDGKLLYQGYPLRLNFMGLFDTVASFGVPAANVQLPFLERDLIVSPKIEQCVHYVAAHEVRFSFPVDLIRKNGQLANTNWIEKTYPGVHSDVGGGYEPVDQGINNNYARIPMRDMMREAVVSGGVRMLGYDTLSTNKNYKALFQERFECKPETEAAYRGYLAACGPLGGTIEKQMQQHMKLLFSAYGTMYRTGLQSPAERRVAEDTRNPIGPESMAWEVNHSRVAAKDDKWIRISDLKYGYAQYSSPKEWQIAAWDAQAPAKVVSFVSQFVHDSKLNIPEPISYFKPRGVDESTVNIWQEGGRWMGNKAKAVGDAVEAGATATAQATTKAYDATAKAATEAAQSAQRKAQEAADYARTKANQAVDATTQAASDAAQAAQRRAQEAADYASQKAKQATDAATKAASDAAQAAQRKAQEAADGAQSLYDKGMHWIEQTAKDVGAAAKRLGD